MIATSSVDEGGGLRGPTGGRSGPELRSPVSRQQQGSDVRDVFLLFF